MRELTALAKAAEKHAAALDVTPLVHLDDFIFRFVIENAVFKTVDEAVRYYFQTGRDSALKLKELIAEFGPPAPIASLSLLEFAAGYGCVSRHLATALPGMRVVACDIHEQALLFLREALGVSAIGSANAPGDFAPGSYDVVFALSFFSHMPRRTWGEWVKALYGAVNSGGVLLFTAHGRVSCKHFGDPKLPADGFWFRPNSEQKDLSVADYGQTIVTNAFVRRELRQQLGKEPDVFREGIWWSHQDLYVVRKP